MAKWWFGGTASACAAAVTHPLDLLKVHLQIQESQGINRGMMSIGRDIVEKEGQSCNYVYVPQHLSQRNLCE